MKKFFCCNLGHSNIHTGWSKKSLCCDLEEKCLRNSKMFFDGVFLSIYSHLLKKLELFKLCRKKSYGALKIPKMAVSKLVKKFKFFFLFYPCYKENI